jgi:hypothetical protein
MKKPSRHHPEHLYGFPGDRRVDVTMAQKKCLPTKILKIEPRANRIQTGIFDKVSSFMTNSVFSISSCL